MIDGADHICLWPDGTWCWLHELHEYGHMSDDYETFGQEDSRWRDIQSFSLTEE